MFDTFHCPKCLAIQGLDTTTKEGEEALGRFVEEHKKRHDEEGRNEKNNKNI